MNGQLDLFAAPKREPEPSKFACLVCEDEGQIADPLYPGWYVVCECREEEQWR